MGGWTGIGKDTINWDGTIKSVFLETSADIIAGGNIKINEGNQYNFGNVNSYMKVSTLWDGHYILKGDGSDTALAGDKAFQIYANADEDSGGIWEPYISLSTEGTIRFVNNQHGDVANRYLQVNMSSGAQIERGGFRVLAGNVGIGTTTPDTKLQVVGTTKFGDDNTNYAGFKADGELELVGTARVKKTDWISAGAIKAPQANPATFVEHGIKGAWQFAEAIEANQESVSGTWKIPNDMEMDVVPIFYIGWSAAGESPGNCRWKFEYLWVTINDNTIANAQESIEVTSAASSTANGLVVVAIPGIDLPGASDKAMFWRITRESGDDLDTIGDTTEMHGNFMEYTSDKLGTALL